MWEAGAMPGEMNDRKRAGRISRLSFFPLLNTLACAKYQ
jgi:hypothetical protein